MRRLWSVSAAVLVVASGCGASIGPTPGNDRSEPPATPIATTHSTGVAATPRPTVAPTQAPPGPLDIGPNGAIVFYRTNDAREFNVGFMINPDGSGEHELLEQLVSGVWSPDRRTLAFPWGDWETGKARPAVIHADGTGFAVLDSQPDLVLDQIPIAWSPDGARIFLTGTGPESIVATSDVGLYSVRSSDGGELTHLVAVPDGFRELLAVSPEATHVLITRQRPDDTDRYLYEVDIDGSHERKVSPVDPDIQLIDFDWWDDASEAWSPDGTRVAFSAADVSTDTPVSLWVSALDGKEPREIVGSDVGATTVRWSPDGKWIAFTSKFRTGAQLWKVRPDGTGLKQLTNHDDGSYSVMPVWSPDSSRLLFQRQYGTGPITLWTMRGDGTEQVQLSATPLAADLIGGYAWWPAPPA